MASTAAPSAPLISSTHDLEAFVSSITSDSTLYIDLEGHNLSRYGTISIITVLVYPQQDTRLIDVATLGESTFTTASKDGKTLRSIFEDPRIPKYLWDVRNDADALWALYNAGLDGVTDIQLLENASRSGDKTFLRGLDKSVQYDLHLGVVDLDEWTKTKREIKWRMKWLTSEDVFAARPMDPKIVEYCVNDVAYLPALRALYSSRIGGDWLAKANEQSRRRVQEAHSADYKPEGPAMALGPWGSGIVERSRTDDNDTNMMDV